MYNHIKFYKRPSCTTQLTGKTRCLEVKSVLTVTNDLGEKFFFGDLDVLVELVLVSPATNKRPASESVADSQTLHWSCGSRAISYTAKLPLAVAKPGILFFVRASVPFPDQAVDQLLESYDTVSAIPATFLPLRSVPVAFPSPTKDKSIVESPHLALRDLDSECPGLGIRLVEETQGSIASHIWDAAMCVAKELCTGPLGKYVGVPRSVIELGAGCGFTGLVMAALYPGARVVLTDFEEAREACERNIQLNLSALPKTSKRSSVGLTTDNSASNERVSFYPLQWEETDPSLIPFPVYHHTSTNSKSEAGTGWDVVLVTDCIYNSASFGPLLHILETLITPGTLLVLAHKYRAADSGDVFYGMLAERFQFVEDYSVERYDERIRLLTVKRQDK